MMALLFAYSFRNLWVRRLTTGLTVAGLGLVVFVFVATLMLANGLNEALVSTGTLDNALILRKGSTSEIASGLYRQQAHILGTLQGIARGQDGRPLVVPEMVVLMNLRKHAQTTTATVTLRGTSPEGLTLRPAVRLIAGRTWHPGTSEIIAGAQIARRFQQVKLGEPLRFGKRDWTVVGVFEAGGSAFESEVWGDVTQLMAAYGRESFSTAILRLSHPSSLEHLRAVLESDPRLSLQIKGERDYYAEKSGMADFIRVLGLVFTLIFSIGSILGATITMYGSVVNRISEIGTLRTLGFRPAHIVTAFLAESLCMSAAGWLLGIAGAALLQFVTVSTTNWATMSELAFGFSLSPRIALYGLLFALGMGALGGVLPALRASRLQVVEALTERAA